ncbi:hypothetical protein FNO01nite_26500 [Flavobacterium noncentrifugens]|uniref:SnoaL-like domain-containing protein n=1 Tax=Flavobacterium noncentrifugens TaxID=1128970 RepID=A0A1G9CC43_9FLAO|nr:nuclear transport factor 2 family protein [Flavobacterium noncentrifugens]GEP51978.1 hypothetical protein FNO01nite_26500 [Flavobacterium noncentrifugens]SDK49014.1 protein of unknown function [Flavobacterium noncentrifugens]
MKKLFLIAVLFAAFVCNAQKKTNGTIYIEHPAIAVVENMTKAFVAGDVQKLATYLSDDFRSYNGVSGKITDKGDDKAAYLQMAKAWHDQLDYYSITPWGEAYPDALEYKKDNDKNVIWVLSWDKLKGVHKATGVKVEMPLHRSFVVDKDNKIKMAIDYMDSNVITEIRQSYSDRTNGTIYNHHEYINTVKKMVYALENKDYAKSYSFYADDARFFSLGDFSKNGISLEEQKAMDKKILEKFEISSIDIVGYPDYLHYELGDGRTVLSWWNFNLIRKSDKKTIVFPIHLSDEFNKDGKITSETAYYDSKLLD